jgi:hypothetical protein
MFETSKHVEVPLRREREPAKRRVHLVSAAMGSPQPMVEEELTSPHLSVDDTDASARSFVLEQRLEHRDRGVEGAVTRP